MGEKITLKKLLEKYKGLSIEASINISKVPVEDIMGRDLREIGGEAVLRKSGAGNLMYLVKKITIKGKEITLFSKVFELKEKNGHK